MDKLVRVVNKLQEVVSLLGPDSLDLPQIVVLGEQSSGKSSVLESLAGQSFLPRGLGVGTRRPLILQLVRRESSSLCAEADCGVFAHDKGRVYTNFEDIRREIVADTIRVAGPGTNIHPEPIILKIFSAHVSTLTMIDLPGLVKVPVGDQPEDVESLVRALALKYIGNLNSIILAVVSATTDIATSEGLKLAKEVDPGLDRTIAVVTKLDLMDAGTDATDILTGSVVPVKLGIIGVVNRSHQHTVEGKSICEALADEGSYLRCKYPAIASRHGSSNLALTLHRLLLARIESSLPALRRRIKSSIAHYQDVLTSLGIDLENPMKTLLNILTTYSNTYCNKITGHHSELETQELTGGARVSYIFIETYGQALDSINPLEGLTKSAILTAMRNTTGVRAPFLVPEICFEILVKKQVEMLEAPSLVCVQLVQDELERIINDLGPELSGVMGRFPVLHQKVKAVTRTLIRGLVPETNEMVRNLVRIHSSYVNTSHREFAQEAVRIVSLTRQVQVANGGDGPLLALRGLGEEEENPSSSTRAAAMSRVQDAVVVERLVTAYFNVVRRSVQDSVPKAVMHFLVNQVMSRLFADLLSQLYGPEGTSELLKESKSAADRRATSQRLLNIYRQAEQVVDELNDTPEH